MDSRGTEVTAYFFLPKVIFRVTAGQAGKVAKSFAVLKAFVKH